MAMKEPESGFRQKVGHRQWGPAGHRASAELQATVPGFFLCKTFYVSNEPREKSGKISTIIAKGWKLVEAVGVEPTSENVTGQEPTYLVQFTRRELPRQIRVVRLERTRNAKR